jgi:SAM-dependent methyltransferase
VTLLADDPALWDTVFHEPPARTRFVARLARGHVLDVGCATGELCRALARRGIASTGVDLNASFIAAARRKLPGTTFLVGDMATFRTRPAELVCCLGTTFSYNLTNAAIVATLANLRRHTRRGGCLVLDVLNAAALLGPRPFRARTRHAFVHAGRRHVAAIEHRLELATQTMTEQVTWRIGRTVHRDPAERLRLLFPQELAHLVATAGFGRVEVFDGYGTRSRTFAGRRLVVVARRT